MAFYHTIRVIQRTRSGVRTLTIARELSAHQNPHVADDKVRKALAWPATVRVEVDETDTQLYGLPKCKRTYQKHVLLADGRIWHFYGAQAREAHLDQYHDARRLRHDFRI